MLVAEVAIEGATDVAVAPLLKSGLEVWIIVVRVVASDVELLGSVSLAELTSLVVGATTIAGAAVALLSPDVIVNCAAVDEAEVELVVEADTDELKGLLTGVVVMTDDCVVEVSVLASVIRELELVTMLAEIDSKV